MMQKTISINQEPTQTDIQSTLDELKSTKKWSLNLQKYLANHPDQNVSKNLEFLCKSLVRIENSLLGTKTHQENYTMKSQYTMKNYSLHDVLKRSIPKAIPNTVKIELPNHDVQIYGHMYKLIVLFSNLIENSIQAMNQKGTISIMVTHLADSVKIDVIDSGPGIPTHIMEKMFLRLSTTKANGTGLGTKMAKTIIDLHGGKISVRNNPTTFTIELPSERR